MTRGDDLFGGSDNHGENLKKLPPINVYEGIDGWTHDFADEKFESEDAAIVSASKWAQANGTSITIDFSLEQKARAKRLGINLYAKGRKTW